MPFRRHAAAICLRDFLYITPESCLLLPQPPFLPIDCCHGLMMISSCRLFLRHAAMRLRAFQPFRLISPLLRYDCATCRLCFRCRDVWHMPICLPRLIFIYVFRLRTERCRRWCYDIFIHTPPIYFYHDASCLMPLFSADAAFFDYFFAAMLFMPCHAMLLSRHFRHFSSLFNTPLLPFSTPFMNDIDTLLPLPPHVIAAAAAFIDDAFAAISRRISLLFFLPLPFLSLPCFALCFLSHFFDVAAMFYAILIDYDFASSIFFHADLIFSSPLLDISRLFSLCRYFRYYCCFSHAFIFVTCCLLLLMLPCWLLRMLSIFFDAALCFCAILLR